MTTLKMPCPNTSHSPRLTAGIGWSCPQCTESRTVETVPLPEKVDATVSANDYAIFTDALRRAVGPDGLVHQRDMRPLIRDRIKPQRIPTLYRRAIAQHLITEVKRERSNDVRGRNTNKDEPVYRLAA